MNVNPVRAEVVASKPRPINPKSRTTLRAIFLGSTIALAGGLLSGVAANPRISAKPGLHKPKDSTVSTHRKGEFASSRAMEQSDIESSYDWLNKTDPPELRTSAPIPATQMVAEIMFPDTQWTLVMEPSLQGLDVYREAPRRPWKGSKTPEEYSFDTWDRISKARERWTQYQALERTIMDRLGAENAPYSTAPHLYGEIRVEFGNKHPLYSGRYVYSSDSLGNVTVRDQTTVRDAFYTPYLAQRALMVNFAEDKLAQAFLSPFYGMDPFPFPFERDSKFDAASDAGNRAAAPYVRAYGRDNARVASSLSSRERGNYWRRAAKEYHTVYHSVFHEKE